MNIYIETTEKIYRFECTLQEYHKIIDNLEEKKWISIEGVTIPTDNILQMITKEGVKLQEFRIINGKKVSDSSNEEEEKMPENVKQAMRELFGVLSSLPKDEFLKIFEESLKSK